MSKPAARIGDSTAHGGTIVAGFPNVLIGGMPAARQGDMHVCPMLNPGTPPPPHVGGPIMLGSLTVLIGGQPAARLGDMVTCSGPPDSIIVGCPTVLIGDSSGGGGGAGGGGGSGGGEAKDRQLEIAEEGDGAEIESDDSDDAGDDAEEDEIDEHYLDIEIVDKGGFPITGVMQEITHPDGKARGELCCGLIQRNSADEGDYKVAFKAITEVKWSVDKAKAGDKVKIQVSTYGFDDGTPADISIWIRDIKRPDELLTTVPDAKVQGDAIERDWTFEYPPAQTVPLTSDGRSAYSQPQYYFKVRIGAIEARSALISFTDDIEFEAVDEDGRPLRDEPYIAYLSNGEVRDGKLDGSGKAKITGVVATIHWLRFPNIPRPAPAESGEAT